MLTHLPPRRLIVCASVSVLTGLVLGFLGGYAQGARLVGTSPVSIPAIEALVKGAGTSRAPEKETGNESPSRTSAPAEENTARAASIAGWQALGKLQDDNLIAHVHVPLFSLSGDRLSDAFAKLFALNPSERLTIEAAVARTTAELARLQAGKSTVRAGAEGSLSIAVPSFPEEGGRLYDALYADIATVMGPDRQKIFLQSAAAQLDDHMAGFGANERSITLSPPTRNEAGDLIYEWSDERVAPDSQGGSSGQGSRSELEQRFGATMLQQIPENFWSTGVQNSGAASSSAGGTRSGLSAFGRQ